MDLCSRSFIQIYSFLETLFENIRKELLGLWHTFLSSWFIFYPTQTRIRFWAWTHWDGHKSFNVHFQNQLFSNIKSGAHSAIGSHSKKKHIATLGPSWSFSLSESLASLSLQDGPQSGIIITRDQPLSLTNGLNEDNLQWKMWNISATTYWIILKF